MNTDTMANWDEAPALLTLKQARRLLKVTDYEMRQLVEKCVVPHMRIGVGYKFIKSGLFEYYLAVRAGNTWWANQTFQKS